MIKSFNENEYYHEIKYMLNLMNGGLRKNETDLNRGEKKLIKNVTTNQPNERRRPQKGNSFAKGVNSA